MDLALNNQRRLICYKRNKQKLSTRYKSSLMLLSLSFFTPGKWLARIWYMNNKFLHSNIYIHIYSHPQTDCFVLSELFSVARHAGRSKPESKPVQLYDRHGHKRTTLAKGIFRYFIFSKQQQQPLFTFFHTLPATRELNSFEEPCITLTVADNSFARELNPHGGAYIVIHRQTVSFYQNSSVWLDTQDVYDNVNTVIRKSGKHSYAT